jgi:hypothetical protein
VILNRQISLVDNDRRGIQTCTECDREMDRHIEATVIRTHLYYSSRRVSRLWTRRLCAPLLITLCRTNGHSWQSLNTRYGDQNFV